VIEDELLAVLEPTLEPFGFRTEDGEEFRVPPLDVLRYYRRPVRLHWLPMLGQAQSVVAVVRQPVDVAGTEAGCRTLLDRLARAVNGRFPPGWALGWGSIGLSAVVLTPEPITANDDAKLGAGLKATLRSRVVPLAVIRINLGQEAMAFQLAGGPDGLFPEPVALVDALTSRFRRFVPMIEWN